VRRGILFSICNEEEEKYGSETHHDAGVVGVASRRPS
jgi:hypothetical protein